MRGSESVAAKPVDRNGAYTAMVTATSATGAAAATRKREPTALLFLAGGCTAGQYTDRTRQVDSANARGASTWRATSAHSSDSRAGGPHGRGLPTLAPASHTGA